MTIYDIMTATEAAESWNLSPATVKRACQDSRFTTEEARKAKGTWLVTVAGMERLYGLKPPE